MRYFFLIVMVNFAVCGQYAWAFEGQLSAQKIIIHPFFSQEEIVFQGQLPRSLKDTELVFIVKGPEENVMFQRKKRQWGMWLNGEFVFFPHIPSYYFLASTRPLREISAGNISKALPMQLDDYVLYHNELIQQDWQILKNFKEKQLLYTQSEKAIIWKGEGRFSVKIPFPSSVKIGTYHVDIGGIEKGKWLDLWHGTIDVVHSSFLNKIHDFTYRHGFLNGFFIVLMAFGLSFLIRFFLKIISPF